MPTVAIIDDDPAMRDSIAFLLHSVGYRTIECSSASAFDLVDRANCLIVDVRLPGPSGLDFQAQLAKSGIRIPIIFVTGHADVPMAARAMKAGAIDFLTKPFRDQDLLDAVAAAVDRERAWAKEEKTQSTMRSLFDSLTPREQEVVTHVVAGLMNKQIAAKMGLSEVTVKVHRSHAMQKLGVRSVADLVRSLELLGPPQ